MSSTRKTGSEFICPIKYSNDLPNVQFPPKLLPVTLDFHQRKNKYGQSSQAPESIVKYSVTTLEEALPYPLLVDSELGMPIDLISMGLFDVPGAVQGQPEKHSNPNQLDDIDLVLLGQKPLLSDSQKELNNHNLFKDREPTVSETTKSLNPKNASTPAEKPNVLQSYLNAKEEAKAASSFASRNDYNAGLKRKQPAFDDSLEYQKALTSKMMEDAFKILYDENVKKQKLASLVHPIDKTSKAVDIIPVLPNKKVWQNSYTLFTFDELPPLHFLRSADFKSTNANLSSESIKKITESSYRHSSILRPREQSTSFGSNKIWLEYFLPESASTVLALDKKGCLDNLDKPNFSNEHQSENMEFKHAKEYEFASTLNNFKQDHYLISLELKDDGSHVAYYTPVKSRFIMKRKKIQANTRDSAEADDPMSVSLISVGLREPTDEERQQTKLSLEELESQDIDI